MFSPESTEPILDEVVARVRQAHGIDFAGYRRATIQRRLAFRMVRVGARSGEAYLRTLAEEPQEATRLLEQLTVKVSRFYRNAPTFDALHHLIATRRELAEGGPLRVWSAGCGHGEEAYTLAMLLGENTSGEVWATDVDARALAVARLGAYADTAVAELPPALARRWLEPRAGSTVRVRDELKHRVHFVHHDLTSAPAAPAAPHDIVCCRNVLIYLTPPVQQRVLELLVRSVRPGGLLCLGEAEWIPCRLAELSVVDRRLRIFQRVTPAEPRS